jgi:putative flippase GtrA
MPLSIQRFLKYSAVGGSTFAFDLALLFVLTDFFGMQYLIAAGGAFLIAVSCNYFISRRYVFKKTTTGLGNGYLNFFAIAGAGLLVVMGGMYVLVAQLGVNYYLARIGIAGLTGFWNYLLNLYVNFKVAGNH